MKLLRLMGILFLLLAAGCGPAAPEPGGYGVEDVRGKSVRLSHPPQKILTDSLHLDETLLTLVPAERLAGAYYLDREPGISFVAEETRKVAPVLFPNRLVYVKFSYAGALFYFWVLDDGCA